MKFDSCFTFFSLEDDIYTFGLADDQFDYKNYLLIENLTDPDPAAAKNGTEGEYLESSFLRVGIYGSLTRIELTDNQIHFHIRENQTDRMISVRLRNSNATMDEIHEFLSQMLRNRPSIALDYQLQAA